MAAGAARQNPRSAEIQAGDKCIDDTDDRVERDIVVDASGKKAYLTARVTFDETHGYPRIRVKTARF